MSPDLADLFGDLVRLETALWSYLDDRLRESHGLPLSWFEPMQVIDRTSGCRVGDIADALLITIGGTSKLVDRIEGAGWCQRRPNPADHRSSVVSLTDEGKQLLDAATTSFVDELRRRLGGGLSDRSLQDFAATTRSLRQHLRAENMKGG